MNKIVFVILAAGKESESLGRVVNAMMGALEAVEAGGDVGIIFDGAGTEAAAALVKEDHKYHKLYSRVRDHVTGACSYCAGAFEVKEALEEAGVPLIDEFKGHASFKRLLDEGATILTF